MHEVQPYRRDHPHSRLLLVEAIIYEAFVIFLFMLLGFVTNADPGAVLLAFFPAFLFGVIVVILIETDHFNPTYNWFVLIMLLVVAAIIYFVLPAAQGIDAGTVLIMNAILMGAALLVLHSSYANEEPLTVMPGESAPRVVHVHHEHASARDVQDVIHSIEDKVKALNFVIGRVYSVYHGGTDRLRNRIRVDKVWYEEFNQQGEHGDTERRRHEAIVLLSKIRDRLELLRKSERDVFGDEVSKLKNIVHDPEGGDAVIDVLIKNDKDPVKRYYDGALEFCTNAVAELSRGSHHTAPARASEHTARENFGSPEADAREGEPRRMPAGVKPGLKRGYRENDYDHEY